MTPSHKINVQIKPNAKENKIIGWQGHYLKIAIKAAPIDGKANKALIHFLAKYCDIHRNDITIVHGESSSIKQIEITTINSKFLALLSSKT